MYAKRLSKLTKRQCVQFSIFCAEQALPVFEKQYPDDSRPREAIDAAKKWLGDPTYVVVTSSFAAYVTGAAYVAAAAYVATSDTAIENYLKELEKCTTENYLLELEKCTTND